MYSNTIVKLLFVGTLCWASLPATGSQSQWAYYPIYENDFHDYFDYGRHGTALDGAVTTFDPLRGWVADFTQNDAGSPRIQVVTEDPAFQGELSISARVKWFGPNGRWQGIAGQSLDPANRSWVLHLQDTSGAIHWPNASTGVVLDQNRWLHLVVTFGQGTSRVYLDGIEQYEGTGVSLPRLGSWATAHVTLGHAEDRVDVSQWFNGCLDDVYFFGRALTGSEVADLFNGIVPSFLKARNPNPANGATEVMMPLFTWTAGDTAFTHRFYIGASPALGNPDFIGVFPKETTNYYHLPGLQPKTRYCWRVDEVEADGTVHTGDVWCFTTESSAPSAAGVMNPCCDPVLTWPPVPGAVAYHVYFGDKADDVEQGASAADKGMTLQPSLPLEGLVGGTTYHWRVDVVRADDAVVVGDVWSFLAPMCDAGGVVREWWLDIQGASVDDLMTDHRYPRSPSGRECIECLEGPTDWADDYGTRLYALLLPPKSGVYTFWVAGDDNTRLYLSPDENPANASLIATVDDWTPSRVWDRDARQRSGPITLSAGKKYYIEAIGKEAGGDDNIAVAWQGPGMIAPEVICRPFVEHPLCTPFIAHLPHPADGADVAPEAILSWKAGKGAVQHDVYFGDNYTAVASATPAGCCTYAGRQSQTVYLPGPLAGGKTYFWRIDEIGPGDTPTVWTGCVWSFTTNGCKIVIDDFESYASLQSLWQYWTGHPDPVEIEKTIVHTGVQSMRMDYDNQAASSYSEARMTKLPIEDWTVQGATTLSLWIHGRPPRFMQTSPNSFVMSASGTDVWGTADEFRYAHKRLNGDGTITARVQGIKNTNGWAKAGVMIRETLDPGSTHAMVVVTPEQGVSFQRRSVTSGSSEATTQPGVHAPYWVKLTRQGTTLRAEHSPDGVVWTAFTGGDTDVTIPMAGSVYIGLMVTGHNLDAVVVAEFSHVSTTGSITGSWQVADIGVAQPGNDACPLYVSLRDSAGRIAVVQHPDNPTAVLIDEWRQWCIPLSAFVGPDMPRVNLTHVEQMAIGLGDPINPKPDGVGQIFVDDICLY